MDRGRWAIVAFALLAGCGPRPRTITIDGSSTVFPIANILAEDFADSHPDIRVVANKSGTGGGLQKLARGEIDIATASRRVEPREAQAVRGGVVEIPIADDGITVVVNPANPVATLSAAQLRSAWSGAVDDWEDLGGSPGRIDFYGPTESHGTFEIFTEAVDGRSGAVRKDVQTDEDYNVIVRAVADDPRGIGYVGFDYYSRNHDRIKAVAVDGVLPTESTIASGTYRPLARPLYLVASRRALARPEVRAFLRFALGEKGRAAVVEARYVPLPPADLEAARRRVATAG